MVRLGDRGVEFAQAGNITNFIFFNHDRLTVRFTLMLIDVLHYSQIYEKWWLKGSILHHHNCEPRHTTNPVPKSRLESSDLLGLHRDDRVAQLLGPGTHHICHWFTRRCPQVRPQVSWTLSGRDTQTDRENSIRYQQIEKWGKKIKYTCVCFTC